MDKIKDKELSNITGGGLDTLSGTIISAITGIIKMIKDAGYDIGSGIRRFVEGDMCDLK